MINLFINRVFRAIKIDIELYEEVEKDKSATLAGVDIHFSISSLLRVAKCSKALSFTPHESPPSSLSWKFESRLVRLGRSPSILF